MKTLQLIFLSIICISILSCKAPKSSEEKVEEKVEVKEEPKEEKGEPTMYDDMAVEMCDCMDGMFSVAERMKTATEEERLVLAKQMQGIVEQGQMCIRELSTKYPEIDFEASNNPKAEEALVRNCPKYAKMKGR